MRGPQLQGPIQPQLFYADALPPGGQAVLVPQPIALTMYVVTFVTVFYNGLGSAPVLELAVSASAPFWISSPTGGTNATQQLDCWIPLFSGQDLNAIYSPNEWACLVSGFACNNPIG